MYYKRFYPYLDMNVIILIIFGFLPLCLMCNSIASEYNNTYDIDYRALTGIDIPVSRQKRSDESIEENGGETDENPTDPKYQEMAEEVVYAHIGLKKEYTKNITVTKITAQISAIKIKKEFQVVFNNGKIIVCRSEIRENFELKANHISYVCKEDTGSKRNDSNLNNDENTTSVTTTTTMTTNSRMPASSSVLPTTPQQSMTRPKATDCAGEKEFNLPVVFPHIDNKQQGATVVPTPPWVARVKPTQPTVRDRDLAMCTAVCVKERTFVTASRCLVVLKVPFTVVVYQEVELPVKVFIKDQKSTRLMYNDISFIITVYGNNSALNWRAIPIAEHRCWSEEYEGSANVVGYVSEYGEPPKKAIHKLYTLPVKVSTDVCRKVLLQENYQVPCLFSCTALEYSQNRLNCQKYLRGLGHAVVQKHGETEALLAITTWAVIDESQALPVGFAVPHTSAFYRNWDCAEKIADSKEDMPADYYSRLCGSGIKISR